MKNVKKNVKYKNSGFTLIELLAVIIILGILMIIAIPSVTSYINNSRKSAYVDTAKEIVAGARNFVNEGKVSMYDTSATYYIKSSCISTENGQKSPYGDFVDDETYVIVTYDGKGYNYYWVSRDTTGQGVPTPTALKDLDEDDIKSDIALGTIIPTKISDDKSNVQVINATCNGFDPAGEGGSTTPTNTAASTILATAQNANQLNQILDTNIYIFKGGTNNPPANYVKFNCSDPSDTSTCEDWRIIGIYNGQMKIIRVGSNGQPTAPSGFTSVQWNPTTPNPGWANSSLKESLNTTYYNTLSDTAKAMIDENGSWDVGPVINTATAEEAYTQATTSGTVVGSTIHTTPWTGKVGLMASYEYLYASGGGDSCLTKSGYNYNDGICGTAANDWLLNTGSTLWTISPRSGLSDIALCVVSSGAVSSSSVIYNRVVVPAVFLKSNVNIVSGDGKSPSTAYVLQ